jgi:hypothetical protein
LTFYFQAQEVAAMVRRLGVPVHFLMVEFAAEKVVGNG